MDDFWFHHFNVLRRKRQDPITRHVDEPDVIARMPSASSRNLFRHREESSHAFLSRYFLVADPRAAQRLAHERAMRQRAAAANRVPQNSHAQTKRAGHALN